MNNTTSTKDVSFLIITNRDHNKYAHQVINSINNATNQQGYTYDIMVYSTEKIKGDNVVWIEETSPMGPLYGFTHMARLSTSEHFVVLTDAILPNKNLFDSIEFLHSHFFKYRKYKITSLTDNMHNPLVFHACGDLYQLYQQTGDPVLISDGVVLRFPVLTRQTFIDHLDSNIFHPIFKTHAGDNWLGYFITAQGETTVECGVEYVNIPHETNNRSQSVYHDGPIMHNMIAHYYKNPHSNYLIDVNMVG